MNCSDYLRNEASTGSYYVMCGSPGRAAAGRRRGRRQTAAATPGSVEGRQGVREEQELQGLQERHQERRPRNATRGAAPGAAARGGAAAAGVDVYLVAHSVVVHVQLVVKHHRHLHKGKRREGQQQEVEEREQEQQQQRE